MWLTQPEQRTEDRATTLRAASQSIRWAVRVQQPNPVRDTTQRDEAPHFGGAHPHRARSARVRHTAYLAALPFARPWEEKEALDWSRGCVAHAFSFQYAWATYLYIGFILFCSSGARLPLFPDV